jgi:anti-anti-sigma factor
MAKISERKLNCQTMVCIDGDLDKRESVEDLKRIVDRLLGDGENEIILNIDNTRAITPSGLGVILKYYKILRERGGCLYITPPQGDVKIVLQTFRLDDILPQYLG